MRDRPKPDDLGLLHQLADVPELVERIRTSTDPELRLQRELRSQFLPELILSAYDLHEARIKAAAINLPEAARLWLTRTSLEQATSWTVAAHKAARFPADQLVTDLCSGIGVDSFALLQRGPVESLDLSAAALQRCEWNIKAWADGLSAGAQVENWQGGIADANELDVSGRLLHVDPDRRTHSDRPARRLEKYCPPLKRLQDIVQEAVGGALKLGPASNFMQKFPGSEIELISLNGECREATVWFGSLAGEHSFRATSLPTGETLSTDPLSAWAPQVDKTDQFVFDPDPAIVRSGLLDALAERHSLSRLDKNDEYLTGEKIPETAFVSAFKVEAVLGNNDKELRRYLRTNPASQFEIKCRHLKVDANSLQKKLPKGEGPPKVILFARIAGKARTIVGIRTKS